MIRNVRQSARALGVATLALDRFVPDDFADEDSHPTEFEIGVVPTFRVSLDDAETGTWDAAKRIGWRFVCLPDGAEHGAIVDVRRSAWRNPRFSRYSYGRRAVRHMGVLLDALRTAVDLRLDCHARILKMPIEGLEVVWLKPLRSGDKDVFLPLSRRYLPSEDVAEYVSTKCKSLRYSRDNSTH